MDPLCFVVPMLLTKLKIQEILFQLIMQGYVLLLLILSFILITYIWDILSITQFNYRILTICFSCRAQLICSSRFFSSTKSTWMPQCSCIFFNLTQKELLTNTPKYLSPLIFAVRYLQEQSQSRHIHIVIQYYAV